MANHEWGTVVAIDRANSVVRAVLDSGAPIVAQYFGGRRGRMPWPLCTATFVNNHGVYICMGPIGDRRKIFHDDFTFTQSVSTVGTTATSGDTHWVLTDTAAASVTTAPASVADGQGVARLLQVGVGGLATLSKATTALQVPDGAALHLNGRVMLGTDANGNTLQFGISDPLTGTTGIFIYANDNTANLGLGNLDGGIVDVADIRGVPFIVDAWYDCDLVLLDGLGVGWVNGDGPYVHDFTTFAGPFSVYFQVGNASGGASGDVDGYIDWATLANVGPVNDPTVYQLN